MADHVWIGTQVAKQAVYALTVGGTFEAGDLFNTKIQNTTVQVVAVTDNPTTAEAIKTALEAETQPEFDEATYTRNGSVVSATVKAAHAGKPINFTLTTTETGGGAADLQTYVMTVTTTNQGPNVLSSSNLNSNAAPTTGDSLFFQESAVDVKWSLDDFSGFGTLALLDIQASYTGKIGLPKRNEDGGSAATAYNEYRPRYLEVDATNVRIGWGEGFGSGRIMLDMGTVQTTVNVYKTNTSADSGYHAVRIKGTHASNAIKVHGGTVDIAPDDHETSTFATIDVVGSGKLRTGPKVTHGSVFVGGNGLFQANLITGTITRIQVHDTGQAIVWGTGNVTDIYVRSGTFEWKGSGNIATITVGPNGTFDTKNNPNNFTVTGVVTIYKGATFDDSMQKGTYSTAWQWHCDPHEATVRLGRRWSGTVSFVT